MNLRFKLAVDHYVGSAFAWLLNLSARFMALLCRRDHTLRRPPRAVLFLKFTSLGSIARAAFLTRAVRARWPHCTLAFACFPSVAPLVRLYPEINHVLTVRDHSLLFLALDTLRLVFWSWRHGVALVIDLEVHSKYSSIVSGLTLARDRAGFAGITSRFRRGLYTHLVFWNPSRRVDLAYRQLGRALTLPARSEYIRPVVPPAARREAATLLDSCGVTAGTLLLGVNPNASDLSLARRWPLDRFAAVINALPPDPRLHVCLLGSRQERPYVQRLASACTDARVIHNLAGRVSFHGFLALLERLSLLLTNDSGPLHLAASLGIPTVSVWGPTHPATYSPRSPHHRKFYHPLYCSPCVHFTDVPPCDGDNQCLQQLDWPPVARAVCDLLALPTDALPSQPVHAPKPSAPSILGYWRRVSVPPPGHPDLDRPSLSGKGQGEGS